MTESELNSILDRLRILPKENEWVEFKKSNLNPEEIGSRISGLSNCACLYTQQYAYLVFGVEDKTKNVVGTKKHFGEEKKGNEELEHWLIQRLDPKLDFRVYDFYRSGLKISLIQIPAAVGQPVRFKHKAYIRIGSITRHLDEFPEKERKIWQSASTIQFESKVAMRGVESEKLNGILSFETYFELLDTPIPTRLDTMIERFVEEKLLIPSGVRFSITNLGALLFAKNLQPFDGLNRKVIRLISYDGKDKVTTNKEFTGRRGYAVAFRPLLKFLDALIPTNEIVKNAIRKEVKLYPEIALRELIANALIHQDFSISGSGPMIEIFTDRIEISNPGKPIIDTLRFLDHHPRSRNERLAYFMRRLNFCEERGSGIDKVVSSCEAYQLPAPDFIDGKTYTRAIIYAPRKWKSMSKLDKIRACYQHCCLKYVSGDYMSNKTLRERFNISSSNHTTASRIITDAIKSDLIKDSNPLNTSKKLSKYIPYWA